MADDDEYDPPEPVHEIVVDKPCDLHDKLAEYRKKHGLPGGGAPPGTTVVKDHTGRVLFSMHIPSRRMRFFDSSEAIWASLDEVLEDIAVAYRKKIKRSDFLRAVEGVLHILDE